MSLKTCGGCKKEKEVAEFSKNRSSKDGLQWKCKRCCSELASSKCWKRKELLDKIQTRDSRVCHKCSTEKPLESFHKNKRTRDGHAYQCKMCARATSQKTRAGNSGYWWKKSRDQTKLHFINLRGGKCHDCGLTPGGEWPLACFDFHHTERKDHHVSALMSRSIKIHYDLLLSEVNKCVVLCSNCHKRRHNIQSRGQLQSLLVSNLEDISPTAKPQT